MKAVCWLKKGFKLSEKEVSEFVGGQIASFKKPRKVEFVKILPRENNEVDHEAVKARWGE